MLTLTISEAAPWQIHIVSKRKTAPPPPPQGQNITLILSQTTKPLQSPFKRFTIEAFSGKEIFDIGDWALAVGIKFLKDTSCFWTTGSQIIILVVVVFKFPFPGLLRSDRVCGGRSFYGWISFLSQTHFCFQAKCFPNARYFHERFGHEQPCLCEGDTYLQLSHNFKKGWHTNTMSFF